MRRGERPILTPSLVGQYIKGVMDQDGVLSGVMIQGELSNYKRHSTGHHYFTLKDSEGAINCVMFRSDAASLRFQPQNGMQVIASGRVTVFVKSGQYQLYCNRMISDGAGDLHVAFEQLKEKLQRDGLFDVQHKKPLPIFPKQIALVTSPVGAAVQDMLRILGARWPMAQVRVVPVRVQGENAAGEIAAAIRWCNWQNVADLIIAGRGGGSIEDLWAFNEEVVARAIYQSEIPVISAVGHEPDFTIADFVADVRAATPSNAAELAVPDQNEICADLHHRQRRLESAISRRLERDRKTVERLAHSKALTDPTYYFQNKHLLLDYQSTQLTNAMAKAISDRRHKLASLAASLDAMSPLKVLGRGYSIAKTEEGKLLSSADDVQVGENISLRLTDGILNCHVEDKTKI